VTNILFAYVEGDFFISGQFISFVKIAGKKLRTDSGEILRVGSFWDEEELLNI